MATELDTEVNERHPVRFLIKMAAFLSVLYFVGRFIAQKKDEYAGLTESEAREKLVSTMGPRVGEDTANEIADQVVPKLKDRGLIKRDPVEAAAADIKDAAKDVKNTAKDVAKDVEDKVGDKADKVTEAVDSIVRD